MKTLADRQLLMQRLLDGLSRRNERLVAKLAKLEEEHPAPPKDEVKKDDSDQAPQKPADASTPAVTPKTPVRPPRQEPTTPAPAPAKKAEDGATRGLVASLCFVVCVTLMEII